MESDRADELMSTFSQLVLLDTNDNGEVILGLQCNMKGLYVMKKAINIFCYGMVSLRIFLAYQNIIKR